VACRQPYLNMAIVRHVSYSGSEIALVMESGSSFHSSRSVVSKKVVGLLEVRRYYQRCALA